MASKAFLQQAYLAYFGRPADPGGLAFYAEATEAQVKAAFSASPESQAFFGSLALSQQINTIYTNLFNRPAEPAGLAYWSQEIGSGRLTLADAAMGILAGAQNDDKVAVTNKLAASDAFTTALDTTAEILGYAGSASIAPARAFLAAVDATTTSLTDAIAGVDASVTAVVAAGTSGAAVGSTFTLTDGVDVSGFTGTSGNDTFIASDVTYTTGDSLNGGAGTDVLKLTTTAAVTDLVDLASIETVQIRNTNAGTAIDGSGWTGVETLTSDRSTAALTVNGLTEQVAVTVNQGNGSDLTVTYAAASVDLTGTADSQAVTLADANVGVLTIEDDGTPDGFETITVATTGDNTVAAIISADLANLSITGTGDLTVTDIETVAATATAADIASLTSTTTGDVTITNLTLDEAGTVTLGAGDDELTTVTLNATATATIDMGAGDDTVSVTGLLDGDAASIAGGAGDDSIEVDDLTDELTVNGGDGTDSLVVASAVAAALDADTTLSNIEILEISDALTDDFDVSDFGVNRLTLATGITASQAITGFTTGGTVTYEAGDTAGDTLTVTVTGANAAGSTSDVLNVVLANAADEDFGAISVAAVETINITADATGTADAGTEDFTFDIAAGTAALRNLTITGDATALDLSGVNLVATVENVTSTAFEGDLTVSIATGGTNGVAINTGAGDDVITGGDGADAINSGAGNDVITGGNAADVINVGEGRDVVNVASNSDTNTDTNSSSTTDFDAVSGFSLSAAITTATDLSSIANFLAATAGGTSVSLLNIDLTEDDGAGTAGQNLALSVEGDSTGAAQAAGATYDVTDGILTLSGAGAAAVDTLAEWLTEAAAVAATDGEALAFEFDGDSYVFAQNAGQDVLVQLVGVTGAAALTEVGAATTTVANTILFGDGIA
jgi:S-layer protein